MKGPVLHKAFSRAAGAFVSQAVLEEDIPINLVSLNLMPHGYLHWLTYLRTSDMFKIDFTFFFL